MSPRLYEQHGCRGVPAAAEAAAGTTAAVRVIPLMVTVVSFLSGLGLNAGPTDLTIPAPGVLTECWRYRGRSRIRRARHDAWRRAFSGRRSHPAGRAPVPGEPDLQLPAPDPRIGRSGPRRERPAKPPCPPAQPGIPVPRQVPPAGGLDGNGSPAPCRCGAAKNGPLAPVAPARRELRWPGYCTFLGRPHCAPALQGIGSMLWLSRKMLSGS